ncbi:GNAT family N-acetyltransferase [Phocaeicola sp.]
MNIRQTEPGDLKAVMAIYDYARTFMQAHGNPNQWINGYPSETYILQEINSKHSFVCENEAGEIIGTFCFIMGEDDTYARIDNGKWLNDDLYGVIHRMASNGKEKGLSDKCIRWCFEQHHNIRVDTHHDNIVMQNILKKNGFTECGIIYTHNGTPRIAYQKII